MNRFLSLVSLSPLEFNVPVKDLPWTASHFEMGSTYLIQVDHKAALNPLFSGILESLWMRSDTASSAVRVIGPALNTFSIAPQEKFNAAMTANLRAFDIHQWRDLAASPEAIQKLLREIEDTQTAPQSLIIFLDLESVMLKDDDLRARLTQALLPWGKSWGHCVIWIAGPQKALDLKPSSLYPFQGAARLNQEGRQIYWTIHHWAKCGGESLKDIAIGIQPSVREMPFEAIGLSIQNNGSPYLIAPDQDRVIVDTTVATYDANHPQSWEIIEDPLALDQYLQGAMAPTLVLGYGTDTQFEDLAHLVESLRQRVGRGLKLVLRETHFRIRNYQERLLYFLGLNAIVHPTERTQELLEVIDSLQGVAFTPSRIDVPIEQLLFAAIPPRAKGYLPPQEFVAELRQKLHPENPFDIRHALIKLDLLPGVTQLTAIQAFRANRPGDLITAGFTEIYLFLFGCSPADISIALPNCFSESVEHYFSSDHQWVDTLTIIEKLGELQREWERDLPPDFSLNLTPGV